MSCFLLKCQVRGYIDPSSMHFPTQHLFILQMYFPPLQATLSIYCLCQARWSSYLNSMHQQSLGMLLKLKFQALTQVQRLNHWSEVFLASFCKQF